MNIEKFKSVDYPDIQDDRYLIDENGNVYDSVIGRLLKTSKHPQGYIRVNIRRKDGTQTSVFIHTLVASTYLGGYRSDLVVNHKDGNKLNNHVSNLEWITRGANVIHAFTNGLMKQGITNYDLIAKALEMIEHGYSAVEIQRELTITSSYLSKIVSDNLFKHMKNDKPIEYLNPSRSLNRDDIICILDTHYENPNLPDSHFTLLYDIDRKTISDIRRGERYSKFRSFYKIKFIMS